MADFCAQCAKDMNFPESDFLWVSEHLTPEEEADGMGIVVLCEGCGPILVNRLGECISQDCCENHGEVR